MRFDGTLKLWNHDQGHGFIEPTQGGPVIPVHVYAFPHDGLPPRLGERLTFELDVDSDGRKRAVDIRRPRRAPLAPPRRPVRGPLHSVRKVVAGAGALVLVAGAGMAGFAEWARRAGMPTHTVAAVTAAAAQPVQPLPKPAPFSAPPAERPVRR